MRFREFHQALCNDYGEEAAAVCHELYFLARRGQRAYLRAALAALRDAWLCWRLPRQVPPHANWVALATLPGSSGWEALAPCVADLQRQGIACSVMIHPRLRGRVAGQTPARPAAGDWRHALAAWRLRAASHGTSVVSPWLVRSCVFRQRLWRGAWTRTFRSDSRAKLLLHNDFDLYAVAAQQAVGSGWRSVCVQHGLPTDEFFPVRAQYHLLWGPSSAQVYAGHGVTAAALGYGPNRTRVEADVEVAPSALYLISQTHTPLYDRALAQDFLHLALALQQTLPTHIHLQILLHPEEVRGGHPYAGTVLNALCQPPPHSLLHAPSTPAMVVGFCSTALLQAACRGHYVVGMAWPAAASPDAQAVGRPAQQVTDAAALCALLQCLCDDGAARARFLQQQRDWLQSSIATDPYWPQHLGGER